VQNVVCSELTRVVILFATGMICRDGITSQRIYMGQRPRGHDERRHGTGVLLLELQERSGGEVLCLKYQNRDGKTMLDLVLESLWMSNGSRELLAVVYGVSCSLIDRWISGERPIMEIYDYSIQTYHEHLRSELKKTMLVSKSCTIKR